MGAPGESGKLEVEIKVQLTDPAEFSSRLLARGFHLETAETLERNTLYDTPEGRLRGQRQLLRIRRYGSRWMLTHKAVSENAPSTVHKARIETETEVTDGHALAAIFSRLGYVPRFVYEKLRTEWTDGAGHVVVDRTPIGDFAELEGEPDWIDSAAQRLGIAREEYRTTSYGKMFLDWKQATGSTAESMTFEEIERALYNPG